MVLHLTPDDITALANYPLVIESLRTGHLLPKAILSDSLVGGSGKSMLVRCAFINGLAYGVKAVTVIDGNPARHPPLPTVQGQVLLFDSEDGHLDSTLDGASITAWKTAGDSALGSSLLSRPDAETLLMIGAGAMAEPLIRAHISVRPSIKKILLWNRTRPRVESLQLRLSDLPCQITEDLDSSISVADIITSATMSSTPLIKGDLVKAGCHIDLVGAFTPTMREADDTLHKVGSWYVDSRETTLDHIGELKIPISEGLITKESIKGDLYDLVGGMHGRQSNDTITVFKNGGGAHLDIMVASGLVRAYRESH